MSLPNYSPKGIIRLGCVPWNNSYRDVRYYSSLSQQESDIASMCGLTTQDYVYIGRNRTLKVNIEADRLYHINYIMYRNPSIGNRWIYCFITDVRYVNDHTTELSMETDVFQTYLYGVDWTLPPCFIDRATTATEAERFMLTPEPSFPMLYKVDGQTKKQFRAGGMVIVTGDDVELTTIAGGVLDAILNPDGYVSRQAQPTVMYGTAQGCGYLFFKFQDTATAQQISAEMYQFLKHINESGAVGSIVSIFSVPDFFVNAAGLEDNTWVNGAYTAGHSPISYQMEGSHTTTTLNCPPRGETLNGYKPKNKKLLYYPYNYLHLIDNQGSVSELRYELFNSAGTPVIDMVYAMSPACQIIVYPHQYRGLAWDYASGFTSACGALGTWSSDAFATWWAQNSGAVALSTVSAAATMVAGGGTIAGAAMMLDSALDFADGYNGTAKHANPEMKNAANAWVREESGNWTSASKMGGAGMLGGAAALASTANQVYSASKQPDMVHGNPNFAVDWATGTQGIYAQRISLVAEYAQQIDQYFDKYGYSIGRIERFSLGNSYWSAHPYWGFIKTVGAVAKSTNNVASTVVTNGGTGTPASALAIINSKFDGGMTWWNTTDKFGDYSQINHSS